VHFGYSEKRATSSLTALFVLSIYVRVAVTLYNSVYVPVYYVFYNETVVSARCDLVVRRLGLAHCAQNRLGTLAVRRR